MKKLILSAFLMLFLAGGVFAQHTTYKIKKGETLDQVAKKFDVSKEALLKINPDLNRKNIEDLLVVIPAKETSGSTPPTSQIQFKEYRVKPKETLYSLAKRYDTTVDEIRKHNPYLYDAELGAGDLIKIPIYENEIEQFNASVQTSTFENLIHIVTPKQTKYGISKQYGMTVEELEELNPYIKIKELQPGQFLRVNNPNAVTKERKSEFAYYKVEPKETFYSLTRKLNISRDSLETLNPILRELGLQADMELRVPAESEEASDEGVLHSRKLDLSKDLNGVSQQNVVVLLPFRLYQLDVEPSEEEEEEPGSIKEEVIKKDNYLQISLDLYSGIKMALNDAEEMGIPVKAEVLDTERSTHKLNQILDQHHFEETHIVIGPLLPNHIEQVARHLKNKNTAIFSPLTSSEIRGSDKVFQTRPSKTAKEDLMVSYLAENKEGKNFMILSDGSNASFTRQLEVKISGIKPVQQEAKSYLQRSDLTKLMIQDQPNWIIVETEDLGAINNAISSLNALRHEYDIRVFTTDKSNINKAEVESEFLSNLNFTYASVDRGDALDENESFTKKYKSQYGISPSSYAIRGYDVTMDAILRSATQPDFFKHIEKNDRYTEYIENRFSYQPKTLDGFYNNAVYLIEFNEDLQLKVLN